MGHPRRPRRAVALSPRLANHSRDERGRAQAIGDIQSNANRSLTQIDLEG